MAKKRKLNSKNPKYWDKSKLKEKKIIKKVYGTAEIRDASTKKVNWEYPWNTPGVGCLRVTAIWYENE